MKKMPFVLLWCLIVFLSGCSKQIQDMAALLSPAVESTGDEPDEEERAVKYAADTTYHNTYLGFSYTVPKGWWMYELSEDNFSEDPEDTSDPALLALSYDGEDSYLKLIFFGNFQFSRQDNHLGFDISAEKLEDARTMASYMESYEEYMLEPDENEYRLLNSSRIKINGVPYERRLFEVIRTGSNNFYTLTLTREAAHGYFLTIRISYWPVNKSAESLIQHALEKALS